MQKRSGPLAELPIGLLESLMAASLRDRREKLGMSQRDLASALARFDVPASRSIINKYEMGPGKEGSRISFAAGRALGIILFQDETGLLDSIDANQGDSVESNENRSPSSPSEPP
ncbi:MAG: hypothetical protein RIB30_09870 [Thalassospira sp.]|uniref:hypothetical protein n=1 Tax=Thalassospira sp. TaxID=1912094 RepID=UPI0032EADFB6